MSLQNDLNNIQNNNEKEKQLQQMIYDIHKNIIKKLNNCDIYEAPGLSLGQDCIIIQYGIEYLETVPQRYFTMNYLNKLEQLIGLKIHEIKPIYGKNSSHIMLVLGE